MTDAPVSSPAPSDTGAPAAAAPATPQAAPPTAAAPTAAAPVAPADDRSNWVPPHRLREASQRFESAQQQWARQEAELRARYEDMERKFNALAGVTPPPNPQVESVRQQFAQLYPGLAKMEDMADKLQEMLDRTGDLENQTSHYWTSYGRQAMDRLFDHAQREMGSTLSDSAKQQLHASFVGYVQSSPELTERYANDPTIVEDFWRAFTSSFIDPIRRTAAAPVPGRASVPLPQDTPGGAPRTSPPAQFQNLDERANAGWALYNRLNNK